MSHHHLYRVEQLARHFVAAGCRVVVHVDTVADRSDFDQLQADLSDIEVLYAERRRCEWGTFALHDAALEASRLLIDTYGDVDHVCLISGSCLPIQPVAELQAYLADNADTDFVESHRLAEEDWVQDGLSDERFTLYFPFGWRSNRWLFDKAVDWQRKLRIKRRIPEHLDIALGSQWWTLTRKTLRAILDDPLKNETDAYFRKCWIVDEAYVQTLVRTHARKLANRSLCLTEFDPQGKPFTFYDDHAHLLQDQPRHFFARKIWHGASGLYNKYLNGVEPMVAARRPKAGKLADIVEAGRRARCEGRPGLLMQSRFPVQAFEPQHSTARPYIVMDGYDFIYEDIAGWAQSQGLELAHGRIFDKAQVAFADERGTAPGCIPANPKIRDWNTEQFLTNLIWNARDTQQAFQFHVSDSTRMASFLLKDPNATIFLIKGAWVMGMTQRRGESPVEYRRRAMRLKLLERKHIDEIESASTRANVISWSLAEVIADPTLPLIALANAIEGRTVDTVTHMPDMQEAHGLNELVHRLGAAGVSAPAAALTASNVRRLRRTEIG